MPTPRVTVGLRVVPKNETLKDPAEASGHRDVAALSKEGNRSSGHVQEQAPKMPLPIVTVASRLLDVGRREEDPESRTISSLARDPPPKPLEFDPVPEGDPYKSDTTLAQPTVLAWAGSFVSALQPEHFPMGKWLEVVLTRGKGAAWANHEANFLPNFQVLLWLHISHS